MFKEVVKKEETGGAQVSTFTKPQADQLKTVLQWVKVSTFLDGETTGNEEELVTKWVKKQVLDRQLRGWEKLIVGTSHLVG